MNDGLVSIITPTYNCGRFIAQTIESVLAQTYTDWEMIIVDDCSTDDTSHIVGGYADPRIHYMHNDTNSGAAISRNRALRQAKGRWIAFLDSDDLWEPTKLQEQVAFMRQHGYAFTYHDYIEIDEESRPLGVHVSGKDCVGKVGMYTCCWPGCLSVMYDARAVGLIQIRDIRKDNDSLLWLHVIEKADCHLLPRTLARYRRRESSITPPSVIDRILWHYVLFHDGMKMNPVTSFTLMTLNIFGNSIKKLFYVKKYKS